MNRDKGKLLKARIQSEAIFRIKEEKYKTESKANCVGLNLISTTW